jgi:hypothetical protein
MEEEVAVAAAVGGGSGGGVTGGVAMTAPDEDDGSVRFPLMMGPSINQSINHQSPHTG